MPSETAITGVRSEWAEARDVQDRFMQHASRVIDGVRYAAHCRQAHEVGGDCFDFIALPDNRLALVVGDASGKGLAAALMIANVQSSLRMAAMLSGTALAPALRAVNRQAYETSPADRYATLFYGVFDEATRTLYYVNAGHNPPMLIRQDGSIVWLETGGAPAGMFPDWNYQEGAVQLSSGDLLIAYTDGVTEAANASGEQWGVDALRSAATANSAEPVDKIVHAIFTAVDEFSGGCQADDITVVALRVH